MQLEVSKLSLVCWSTDQPLGESCPSVDHHIRSQPNMMLIEICFIEAAPPAKKRKTAPASKEKVPVEDDEDAPEDEEEEEEGEDSADEDEAPSATKAAADTAATKEKDAPEVGSDDED